ncbi:hypothetical protein MKleb_5904 (plasmid) [Klebsiella sp. PL-2018]|nr:hypothetical protein MKleb_5904 [Klebsiella sp. PL-2018]
MFPIADTSSHTERKCHLPERFLYASSPVRSLRSVTWLRRALVIFIDCSMLLQIHLLEFSYWIVCL